MVWPYSAVGLSTFSYIAKGDHHWRSWLDHPRTTLSLVKRESLIFGVAYFQILGNLGATAGPKAAENLNVLTEKYGGVIRLHGLYGLVGRIYWNFARLFDSKFYSNLGICSFLTRRRCTRSLLAMPVHGRSLSPFPTSSLSGVISHNVAGLAQRLLLMFFTFAFVC